MSRLPQLMDCRMIMEETGMKRSAAEAIMRAVPSIDIPGVRKNIVRRDDVLKEIERLTRKKPARKQAA